MKASDAMAARVALSGQETTGTIQHPLVTARRVRRPVRARDNLRYGRLDATDEEIEAAAPRTLTSSSSSPARS